MAVGIDITVVKRNEYLTAVIVLNVLVWIILVGTARKDKIRETRQDCFRGGRRQSRIQVSPIIVVKSL